MSPRALSLAALIVLAGCRHDWREADEFAGQIRCGMSRSQVKALAQRNGVGDVRKAWFETAGENDVVIKPGELDFVDVWFEGDRAVQVQRGNYVAFTTAVDLSPKIELCVR